MTPRTTPSDRDLVRRIRDGEGDAAASLRARHWPAVFDFALRMTASVETARNIADDVFASVVATPPPDDEPFTAWAFAAAHRKVMAVPDRLPSAVADLDDVEIVIDLRDEREPVDGSLAAGVWDAVTRLDRQTQAVVDLHLRQGLEPSELAPMLGISAGEAAEVVQDMKRNAAETIAVHLLRSDDGHVCTGLDEAAAPDAARDHIASCDVCAARRAERYSPLQILGALRVVPAVTADSLAVPVGAAAVPLRRRLATPLGLLAMLAGAFAFVLVGALAWNGILRPLGERVIDVVRSADPPPTTAAPPTTTPPPPVVAAAPDSVQTSEDEGLDIDVLGNDGGSGVVSVIEPPDHGTATVVGSLIRYEPAPNYNGPDTFTYGVVADDGSESSAGVGVTIIPVDDIPEVVRTGAIPGVEDEPLTVAIEEWVVDVDGDPLAVVGFDATSAAGGVVTETLLYTPAPHHHGSDSFEVVVSDGTTEVAFVVLVDLAAVNDLPVGPSRLAVGTDEDQTLRIPALAGWSDADEDELVVLLLEETTPLGASLGFASGAIVYEPPRDAFGVDRFTYGVGDGTDSVTVVVDVTIAAVQDAPRITRSTFTIDENSPAGSVVGTVRAADPEGDAFSFSLRKASSLVAVSRRGEVEVLQSLDHEALESIVVEAVVTDAAGASRRFDLVVRVADVDEAPTGSDQQIFVTPFAPAGTNIARVQITDPEGGSLKFAELNGDPANAVVVTRGGMVRTAREAEPILFPLTLAVEATDPGGQSTTVLVVVRLDDFVGPEVGEVQVSEDIVWEQRPNGTACPFGPSRSDISVAVSDLTGIASATIEWSAVFDGVPLSGETRMAVAGGVATGSFSFGAGLVEPGGESLLTASIVVADRAGNRTTSDPFTIIVRSCSP